MVATLDYTRLAVGAELPAKRVTVSRLSCLLHGGPTMRLDFAATHWSERIAREVGLPDIILHGPFTLAKTLEIVNDWTGDPGAIVEHHIRLRKPVVVPDDGVGAVFDVTGVVRDKLDGNRVVLELTATSPAGELLATADVTVVLKA
ncbi:MAG TPA: MaoC/PaaZ C-terminal domain-containing protein [Kutzneria sp.]|jgi:acyl dehydratase